MNGNINKLKMNQIRRKKPIGNNNVSNFIKDTSDEVEQKQMFMDMAKNGDEFKKYYTKFMDIRGFRHHN